MDLKAIKTGSGGEEEPSDQSELERGERHVRQLKLRFEDAGHLSPDLC